MGDTGKSVRELADEFGQSAEHPVAPEPADDESPADGIDTR